MYALLDVEVREIDQQRKAEIVREITGRLSGGRIAEVDRGVDAVLRKKDQRESEHFRLQL